MILLMLVESMGVEPMFAENSPFQECFQHLPDNPIEKDPAKRVAKSLKEEVC